MPALRALTAEGFEITLAAQPRLGALLVALGVVERAVAFDTLGLEVLFADTPLATEAPLARHIAGAGRVICWFGARERHFARRLRELAPEAVIAPPATSSTAVWQHLLRTVGGAAACAPIVVARALVDEGRRVLRAAGGDALARVLLVHPGAGGTAKRWPTEAFVEVCATVDATIVVHEGPADGAAVRAFVAEIPRPVLRLVDPPLPTLAGILAGASAYLGNDSGVSHLAAAVGTPAVVLFTEAALPWVPWSPTARCLPVTTTALVDRDRRAVTVALAALL